MLIKVKKAHIKKQNSTKTELSKTEEKETQNSDSKSEKCTDDMILRKRWLFFQWMCAATLLFIFIYAQNQYNIMFSKILV